MKTIKMRLFLAASVLTAWSLPVLLVAIAVAGLVLPAAAQEKKEQVVYVKQVRGADRGATVVAAYEELSRAGYGWTGNEKKATTFLHINVQEVGRASRGTGRTIDTRRVYNTANRVAWHIRNRKARNIIRFGANVAYDAYRSRKRKALEEKIFRVTVAFTRPDGRGEQIQTREVRLETRNSRSGDRFILVIGTSERSLNIITDPKTEAAVMALQAILGG